MPTFNRPQFINRAINAILSQSYENWELIIQNGGESIKDIIPQDPRIKLFEEKDKGITDAMNKGMARATGDIFNWHNDDDEVAPNTFKIVVDSIKDHKWLYGYIYMTNGSTGHYWGDKWQGLTRLVDGNHVPQPSVYWKRDLYEEVGGMDESEDLTSDYEYWLRFGSKYNPLFLDRIMAFYHLHDDQITNKQTAEQIAQAKRTAEKYVK